MLSSQDFSVHPLFYLVGHSSVTEISSFCNGSCVLGNIDCSALLLLVESYAKRWDFLCTFMGWNAGRKSNGLDFSDDCTECAQIAAANAVAAASMHSRCKVPPNCVSIQYIYRKGKLFSSFMNCFLPFVEIIWWFVFDLQTCGSSIFMFLIHCSYDFVYFSIIFEKKLSLEPVWNVPKRLK